MNIKKVNDKPLVIHTKKKAKIHVHKDPETNNKIENIYKEKSRPIINDSIKNHIKINIRTKFHKAIFYNKGKVSYRKQHMEAKREKLIPIVKNGKSIKLANMVAVKAVSNQMEGTENIRDSISIMAVAGTPFKRVANGGARLFFQKAMKSNQSRKIKQVETDKKIFKKSVKETSLGSMKRTERSLQNRRLRNTTKTTVKSTAKATATTSKVQLDKKNTKNNTKGRMITFFLSKLKQEDNQESLGKVLKDLVMMRLTMAVKYIATFIGGALLVLFLLIAVACIPVIIVIAIIYNSPLAIFFPPLDDGDSIQTVLSAYVSEFNGHTVTEANNHSGYDRGEVIYVDFEGDNAEPTNYYDVMAVYMIKYGIGETASVMNDKSKTKLKGVFDDMNSYTISYGTIAAPDAGGVDVIYSVKYVNVTKKNYRDMISEYGFDADKVKLLEELLKPENLIMIGGGAGSSNGSGGGGSASGSGGIIQLSEADRIAFMSNLIPGQAGSDVALFVMDKLGIPYSQDLRDDGNNYDCSSLAFYSWKEQGINLTYEGANTAAQEAKYCYDNGYTVTYEEMKPGDLIFYSFGPSNRFKSIGHVAIYAGAGKLIDASSSYGKVVYRDVYNRDRIVLIGRPDGVGIIE